MLDILRTEPRRLVQSSGRSLYMKTGELTEEDVAWGWVVPPPSLL